MDGTRYALIVIAVALAALAGWFLYSTPAEHRGGFLPSIAPPPYEWDIAGGSPWIVGGPEDRFAYAGGIHVTFASGTARIRATTSGRGRIELGVDVVDAPILVGAEFASKRIELSAVVSAADGWFEGLLVNGGTGRGDARLPTTYAELAGTAEFGVTIDGVAQPVSRLGWWSVADAVRRADGSIRQEGLLFTPLLRDKSGFGDPTRAELTVLIYAPQEGEDNRPVELHLVFCAVRFENAPEGVSRP